MLRRTEQLFPIVLLFCCWSVLLRLPRLYVTPATCVQCSNTEYKQCENDSAWSMRLKHFFISASVSYPHMLNDTRPAKQYEKMAVQDPDSAPDPYALSGDQTFGKEGATREEGGFKVQWVSSNFTCAPEVVVGPESSPASESSDRFFDVVKHEWPYVALAGGMQPCFLVGEIFRVVRSEENLVAALQETVCVLQA